MVAIIVLMLILPLPALVFEIFIGFELAAALGILVYAFTKHTKAMPKLIFYFALFSLAVNIGLTRLSLIGFKKMHKFFIR